MYSARYNTQHFVIERSMSMHKKLHSYDIHMHAKQHTEQVEPRAFHWTARILMDGTTLDFRMDKRL